MVFCKVILTNSLQTFSDHSLTYQIPSEIEDKIRVGQIVEVPFRNTKETALVIDIYTHLNSEEQGFKIRDIEDPVSEEIIYDKNFIELIKFTADYYACSLSEVLGASLATKLLKKPSKLIILNDQEIDNADPIVALLKKARKQQLRWSRLKTLSGLKETELKKTIAKLKKKNLITISFQSENKKQKKKTNHLEKFQTDNFKGLPELTEEQNTIITALRKKLNQPHKALIHGVTGSGKTEIYLRLLQETLAQGKNAILLVPEIALAPQLIERTSQRFGSENVLVWHSNLSGSEREFSFRKIIEDDEPKVIIGARSAIFAPVKNLGLIILDEEHENSYKQESPNPRYHARHIACKRSELENALLVMGSATPSIETFYRAVSNEYLDYSLHTLSKRVFDNPLPKVSICDMREEFNNANKSIFSRFLKSNIDEALGRQEQIILFLNKRGTASHVFCRNCGFVYNCKNCDAKMVYHGDKQIMLCHHCNFSEAHPQECPECGSPAIKFFGLGTQKLEEETKRAFPQARIKRLDSDVSKLQNNYFDIWTDFKNHNIDILIGTQMIAKGLDNPHLTVVGVISADTNFSQLDYQADERGFQLLTQVAGRAGRADKPGIVIFQTYQPERSALLDARKQDYLDFYQKEIALREEFCYPPFAKIIRILASSEKEHEAISACNLIHAEIYKLPGISILGPSPALLGRLSNKFRYHLVIRIPHNNADFRNIISAIKLIYFDFSKKIKTNISIDIDNTSLF
jgi:primosomal protein N' (replication factor Y)